MNGEALMVLLEWTIYGFSGEKKLGLPASQSKMWLADRSFWQSWVNQNEPQHLPPVTSQVYQMGGHCLITIKQRYLTDACRLAKTTRDKQALQGLQLMTSDYIKGKAGFYMTLESFSNSRKCEHMIAKIKSPVRFHLLDHIIIPINVQESHWFPVHMDVKFRRMSFLDSSYAYSASDYPRQKMI